MTNPYRLICKGEFWMAVGPDALTDPNNAYRGVGRTPEEALQRLFSFGEMRLRFTWGRIGEPLPTIDEFIRECPGAGQ